MLKLLLLISQSLIIIILFYICFKVLLIKILKCSKVFDNSSKNFLCNLKNHFFYVKNNVKQSHSPGFRFFEHRHPSALLISVLSLLQELNPNGSTEQYCHDYRQHPIARNNKRTTTLKSRTMLSHLPKYWSVRNKIFNYVTIIVLKKILTVFCLFSMFF